MSESRRYVSPKREAQAAATRDAILEAFMEQLADPGRDTISPKVAAARAGVSVRTVHTYFPNHESQVRALGDYLDRLLYPDGFLVAQGPDDLSRYFRDIHTLALQAPEISGLVAIPRVGLWSEVRQRRRTERLDAIRQSVSKIGAPEAATEEATAMLLSLSGADASLPLHELYGLPLDRIPAVIARTVDLIVSDLRAQRVSEDST